MIWAAKRAFLEEAKPHWGIAASALIALGTTAVSQSQQAAAKRNQRNQNALNNLPGGGTAGAFQAHPSALESIPQGAGLGDVLKNHQGTELPQGAGLNDILAKHPGTTENFSPSGQAPAPGASDKDFHLLDDTSDSAMNKRMVQDQMNTQLAPKPQTDTGLGTNDYIGLAQSAGQIASGLAQGPPAPPGFMPSPGPMNYQPTALQMLLARQRRGF